MKFLGDQFVSAFSPYVQGVENMWNYHFIFPVVREKKHLNLVSYGLTYLLVPDVIVFSLIGGVLRRLQ